MKNIFFVCYGGGHANIIDLVARELKKRTPEIDITVLGLTKAYPRLCNTNPPYKIKKVSDYISLFDNNVDEILNYGINLLNENYDIESGINKLETICYLGLSMYDLVSKHGLDKAQKLYEKKKRQAFLPTSIMEKILIHEKPKIVISTTAPRFEQASYIAAHQLNIETLEILDLFGELYPLPEANNIVVMNESIKKSLIQQGLKNKNYYVLGQPAIEQSVSRIKSINSDIVLSKLGITKEKEILVYFAQVPAIYNEDFSVHEFMDYEFYYDKIFTIFKNISSNNDINILFRMHPSETPKQYKKWINKYENIYFINDLLTLEESVAISNIVLTPASTVAIEAIASNKKVLTFQHEYDKFYPAPIYKQKPFIFSKTFLELEKNLNIELNKKTIKKDLYSKKFLQQNSAKNISILINKLISTIK